jgi:hypothetical protein
MSQPQNVPLRLSSSASDSGVASDAGTLWEGSFCKILCGGVVATHRKVQSSLLKLDASPFSVPRPWGTTARILGLSLSLSLCVYVHIWIYVCISLLQICVCIYVWEYVCVCKHVLTGVHAYVWRSEVIVEYLVQWFYNFFFFWYRVSYWTQYSPTQLVWLPWKL